MSKPKMTVEGTPRLHAALLRVSAAARASAAKVVKMELDSIQTDARAGAPTRSGELQRGIVTSFQGVSGTVKAGARHSLFVEFGTYKDTAQPYMAPAAAKSRTRLPGLAATIIGAAVRKGG